MIREVRAKSILRRQKHIDSWFLSRHGVNLYRGCAHNCVYCDGRDEKYQVEGDFGRDISVKINALELLERELDPSRKRKPFGGGYMFVCGGVSDSYQHFEKQYGLTRRTLELMRRFNHPVHMLTKSTMIERDIGLLTEIRDLSAAVVSFSFSTSDDGLGRRLEPGASSPSSRLDTIKRFKDADFSCGMYLMPAVPFLTDSSEMLEATVAAAKAAGVDFIVFSGMTLKSGIQKEHFLNFIEREFPQLLNQYRQLYADESPWGGAPAEYSDMINRRFAEVSRKYRMPKRMPPEHWPPAISMTERILLILDQLDYLAAAEGRNSPYGYAARTLSKADKPLEQLGEDDLRRFGGVGPFTVGLIREIVENGNCSYYNRLLI